MRSASSSRPLAASISRTMVSASPAPPQAASTMARSRRRRGAKIPGVSMNTSWLAPSTAMPRTGIRVVCTLRLTMLILAPTRVLTSVDLPAFGAPMTAMKPQRVSGAGAWSLIGDPSHALAREQSGGGSLFRGALARAFAARGLRALDAHLGGEARCVIGALAGNLHVLRQVEALALRPLLQGGLGIGGLGGRSLELGAPVRAHDIARLLVARLEKNRTQQGFAGIGQDRLLVASPGARFRFAQVQGRAEIQGASDLRAGATADQPVEESGKLTFAGRRIILAQELGDAEAQHAVAQEFEPLVVAALGGGLAHAGVRQRLLEQRAILKGMAETCLEVLELADCRHGPSVLFAKFACFRGELGTNFAI